MRRGLRLLGTALILLGVAGLAWAALVWAWKDPVTSAVTWYEQRKLESQFESRVLELEPPAQTTVSEAPSARGESRADSRRSLRQTAAAYRRALQEGDALGRLRIPKLDLSVIAVEGTDVATLRKGPGRHDATYMPGEGQLVYVAGHRTTYGAPFSRIDRLVRGDRVVLELPYATFEYAVTGRRIVPATYLQALRTRQREEIALQACWPRFFASHRIIVYARPVRIVRRRGGAPDPAR